MKTYFWILAVLLAFTAGWFTGRKAPVAGPTAEVAAPARATPPQSNAARETSRQRWAEKLGGEEWNALPTLIGDIPKGDRGPVLEAWLGSFGIGGLDGNEVGRLHKMLDAWVAADFEGAWQWAGSLRDPGMRELAMTGIAGSLSGSDPQHAFECLVAHGEFHHGISDGRIFDLMRTLSKEAAKQGPLAIAELWEKFPKAGESVNSFSGVDIGLDPATDFRTLIDALRKLGKPLDRPMHPSNVMGTWMQQDPDAATGYLVERIAANEDLDDLWGEARSVIAKEQGSAGADQWTLDLLRSLPEGQRGALLTGANYPNSPQRFFDLLSGASGEEADAWISETLRSSADKDSGTWRISNLLRELPVEKRIEYLKTMRGPKALESAGEAMANWGFSESQKEEVRKAVGGS